jgi:hypothetical protein
LLPLDAGAVFNHNFLMITTHFILHLLDKRKASTTVSNRGLPQKLLQINYLSARIAVYFGPAFG